LCSRQAPISIRHSWRHRLIGRRSGTRRVVRARWATAGTSSKPLPNRLHTHVSRIVLILSTITFDLIRFDSIWWPIAPPVRCVPYHSPSDSINISIATWLTLSYLTRDTRHSVAWCRQRSTPSPPTAPTSCASLGAARVPPASRPMLSGATLVLEANPPAAAVAATYLS